MRDGEQPPLDQHEPAGQPWPARWGLQFAGIYLPFLNDLLKTKPLTAFDLLVVFVLSTLGYAAIRLDRVIHKDGRWRPAARRGRP